jgi:predicted nucleotidyltransferase
MILSLFDLSVAKVLILFSLAPGIKLKRKEIKEKTKLTNLTLDKALNILLNSSILLREDNYFKLNLNEETKTLIKMIQEEYKNLNEIPLNAFFSILEIAEKISALKDVEVYLFGSYAKLTFTPESDIDLAIVSERELRFLEKQALKIEKKYKTKIQLHFFPKDFKEHKEDPLVKEILRNGIKLIG